MKSKIILLLTIMGVLTSAFAVCIGEECKHSPQHSRIYVTPSQVHLDNAGIFLEIEGTLYQVSRIDQDERGIYVPHTKFWRWCANGHPNPPWRITCQVCKLGL